MRTYSMVATWFGMWFRGSGAMRVGSCTTTFVPSSTVTTTSLPHLPSLALVMSTARLAPQVATTRSLSAATLNGT